MDKFFSFVTEGHGVRPEDRIWLWLLLGACLLGMACLPLLDRVRRHWWRRRR